MNASKTLANRAAGALNAKMRRRVRFPGSANYWANRYDEGGNSGAGSYGEHATFKAQVLNEFVTANGIGSVLEFGCGDGNQLSLASYPRYLGVDVAPGAIDRCIAQFADDATKSFMLFDAARFSDPAEWLTAELTLSLDVLYHLIEDVAFEQYMRLLFAAATRFVIIYSSNEDLVVAAHVRHRKFTDWIDQHLPDWQLHHFEPNPMPGSTGRVDFYVYGRGA